MPFSRKLVISGAGLAISILISISLVSCGDAEPAPATEALPSTAPSTNPSGTHSVAIDGRSLNLPEGYTIKRWVSGRGSLRMMAPTNDGYLLVTETSKGNVLAFRLADENPQAVAVVRGLKNPSGVAFHDGFIWVADETQVSKYRYEGEERAGDPETVTELPDGGHGTRTIGFGADGKLYLTIGSSCNVCEEDDSRRAAMLRFNADGIGDDLPPEEVNIIRQGKNYGWPYCYGSWQVNPEYADDQLKARFCEATEPPVVEMQAHSAPLGLCFLTGPGWPAEWQRNLFVAFHGSWNRTVPTGYKVVRIGEDKQVNDFITGWLDEKTGKAWGRPVDILFVNNKMYVSDDAGGSIYRVSREQ